MLLKIMLLLINGDALFYNREFGDIYYRSIEEPWYKSAVLQHELDPKSLVISVPFDAGL